MIKRLIIILTIFAAFNLNMFGIDKGLAAEAKVKSEEKSYSNIEFIFVDKSKRTNFLSRFKKVADKSFEFTIIEQTELDDSFDATLDELFNVTIELKNPKKQKDISLELQSKGFSIDIINNTDPLKIWILN